MSSFTQGLKLIKHPPRRFLLPGLLASVLFVTMLVVTREPTTVPSNSFDNDMPLENRVDQNWETYETSDTENDRKCLPLIFYDKPVKTGSTAVEQALLSYIRSIGERSVICHSFTGCSEATEEVCLGTRRAAHLVHHVRINSSRVNCLHETGYYHLTSIREPKERIFSVFKYNRAVKGRHYGIPHNVTFEEFLEKYPRCALYNGYDSLGTKCPHGEEELRQRAKNIADKMDEVIDLSEEAITDVHKRIYRFIVRINVVSLELANTKKYVVPDEVSKAEYVLYNMLRKKRQSLAQQPKRFFCSKRRGSGVSEVNGDL